MEDRENTNSQGKTRRHHRHGVEHYCRNLEGWPQSWMGLEKDLLPGRQRLTLFCPFLEHLAASHLSPKTIRKHADNMWALGGEFYPGSPLRPANEKEAGETGAPQNDRIRRAAALSRRGSGAKLVRFDEPEVQEIPRRDSRLTLPGHPQIPPTRQNSVQLKGSLYRVSY